MLRGVIFTAGASLWIAGAVSQSSSELLTRYILLSLLIAAVLAGYRCRIWKRP